jgi:hypothetical protein
MGAGYGVMVCRKRGLDGVLIGRWDAQQHLRREGGGGVGQCRGSQTMRERKKKNLLGLRLHTCNCNTAARVRSVSAECI